MAPVPPFWDIFQWQNFPGNLNTWPNTSSKRIFLLPFLQPKKKCPKIYAVTLVLPLKVFHLLCTWNTKQVPMYSKYCPNLMHTYRHRYPQHKRPNIYVALFVFIYKKSVNFVKRIRFIVTHSQFLFHLIFSTNDRGYDELSKYLRTNPHNKSSKPVSPVPYQCSCVFLGHLLSRKTIRAFVKIHLDTVIMPDRISHSSCGVAVGVTEFSRSSGRALPYVQAGQSARLTYLCASREQREVPTFFRPTRERLLLISNWAIWRSRTSCTSWSWPASLPERGKNRPE